MGNDTMGDEEWYVPWWVCMLSWRLIAKRFSNDGYCNDGILVLIMLVERQSRVVNGANYDGRWEPPTSQATRWLTYKIFNLRPLQRQKRHVPPTPQQQTLFFLVNKISILLFIKTEFKASWMSWVRRKNSEEDAKLELAEILFDFVRCLLQHVECFCDLIVGQQTVHCHA